MNQGRLGIEVDQLDTAIVVPGKDRTIGWVDGQAEWSGRQKECMERCTIEVVPHDASLVLRRRNCNVGGARAMAECKGSYGGSVI